MAGKIQGSKGFRIYLVGKESIEHVASWHQIQNEEQFGVDLAAGISSQGGAIRPHGFQARSGFCPLK